MVLNRIITSAALLLITGLTSTATESQTNSGTTEVGPPTATSAEKADKVDYTPKIHGVLRTRWEGEWGGGADFAQRFQVRNARLSVEGKVLRELDYFVRIDACDRGKMKILDAWARWQFAGHWRVQAGQFRVPYAVDCFRGPGAYYFANRSFMAKHMLNMREVGAKIGYYGTAVPVTVEAGVFNSAPMSDHDVWQRQMNYAAKATWAIWNVTLAASFISTQPEAVRMNIVDGAATWKSGRWIVEGEYQHQHYSGNTHSATDGWNLFGSYGLPLRHSAFNTLSFQARYDGMTAHSTGKANDEGNIVTNDPSRQRITLGSCIEFSKKPLRAAIRLNYEKYFYSHGDIAPKGENDKIVAELVVKF